MRDDHHGRRQRRRLAGYYPKFLIPQTRGIISECFGFGKNELTKNEDSAHNFYGAVLLNNEGVIAAFLQSGRIAGIWQERVL